MDRYIRAHSDVYFTGPDGSLRSNRASHQIARFRALVPSIIRAVTDSTEQFNIGAISSRDHLERYASSTTRLCSPGSCFRATSSRTLRSAGAADWRADFNSWELRT